MSLLKIFRVLAWTQIGTPGSERKHMASTKM